MVASVEFVGIGGRMMATVRKDTAETAVFIFPFFSPHDQEKIGKIRYNLLYITDIWFFF